MRTESQRARLINSYLLGELSEEERGRLEEQYFADDALSREVQAARDDLIDAYLRGELSRDERERFEKYFMASPRRRERVEFAAALLRPSAPEPAPSSARVTSAVPPHRWRSFFAALFAQRRTALAAAALIVIAFGSWVAFNYFRQRARGGGPAGQIASAPQGQIPPASERPSNIASGDAAAPAPARTEAPPPAPKETRPTVSPPRQPRVATFTLTPGLLRADGGAAETILIPRGTDFVLLRFGLDGEGYESYRAQLRTPGGAELWSDGRVSVRDTKSGKTAALRVPAGLLKEEDYTLSLSGVTAGGDVENVARFYFRVKRQ